MANEISAAQLLKAQNIYGDNIQRNANLPKANVSDAVSFHKMASQQLNKFSQMNAEQILNHVKQVNSKPADITSIQGSSTITSTVGEIAKTIKTDEEVKKRSLVGDASLTEVIEASTEAKSTLQTAVAVRNKLFEAFEKIMNMPI